MNHLRKTSILIFFNVLLSYGQNPPCINSNNGSYWPLKVGIKHEMIRWRGNKSEKIEIDSIAVFNNRSYYRQKKIVDGKVVQVAYFRKTDNNTIVALNEKNGKESTQIFLNPKLGQEWIDEDGTWKYEIINLNYKYRTPYCEFDSVMVVKCSPTDKNEDKIGYAFCSLLYKKGIGNIGILIEGKEFNFIKTD